MNEPTPTGPDVPLPPSHRSAGSNDPTHHTISLEPVASEPEHPTLSPAMAPASQEPAAGSKRTMLILGFAALASAIAVLVMAVVVVPRLSGETEATDTEAADTEVSEADRSELDDPGGDAESAGAEPEPPAPSLEVSGLVPGSVLEPGEMLTVSATVSAGQIATTSLVIDDVLVDQVDGGGAIFYAPEPGVHIAVVRVTLADGGELSSDPVQITGVEQETTTTSAPLPTGHDEALGIFQLFEDAVSSGNWTLARQLEPAKAHFTDTQWREGYGLLERASVIPAYTISESGAFRRERIGLITNEYDASGAAISKMFCLTWEADITAGTMHQTGDDTVRFDDVSGHVRIADYADLLSSQC